MGQFKERPYANTIFKFGGPLVSELERYLPPARNDYVHDGLVSDGGLLGSAFGAAAGGRLGARAGAVLGLPGGLPGAFLGGALGYFGGAYAGHLGVRGAEVIGGILSNPSSYDVDPLGNPIGPSALQDQSAPNSKEPAVSPFESAHKVVPFVPYQSAPYSTARLSGQTFEDRAPVLRLGPQPQDDHASTSSPRLQADQSVAASAAPSASGDIGELLKLRSIIQAVGSRGLFPIQ